MQRSKSFAARLAALEALEATAEAEQQVIDDLGIPDVATMDDGDVLWSVVLGVRAFCLDVQLSAPLGPVRLGLSHYRDRRWSGFYAALVARAQPLLDRAEKPLIFLGPWEGQDALAAIDAGEVVVTWSERSDRVRQWYHLRPRCPKASGDYDEDLCYTLRAVDRAHALVNRQRYYPQPRDFSAPEMTTLEEWRDWLMSLY